MPLQKANGVYDYFLILISSLLCRHNCRYITLTLKSAMLQASKLACVPVKRHLIKLIVHRQLTKMKSKLETKLGWRSRGLFASIILDGEVSQVYQNIKLDS